MVSSLDFWLFGWRKPKTIDDYVEIARSSVTSLNVSFNDNIDEPIHRWIRFPAGFSAELVRVSFKVFGIEKGQMVLDPFTGSGTLNVEAKRLGINSIGIEAHPLLVKIARVKVNWELDIRRLRTLSENIFTKIRHGFEKGEYRSINIDDVPELLLKVYDREVLQKLYYVRNVINAVEMDNDEKEFFELALLAILRETTSVDVGWPYILPKKTKRKPKEVYQAFVDKVTTMISDLELVKRESAKAHAVIYESDARNMKEVEDESVDFIFTSPPYLNNYDYADRTRLELYFLGWCKTWGEITEKVRKRLIISSTTQIVKSEIVPMKLSDLIPDDVREELMRKIMQLKIEKNKHGGKKDYDFMVLGYMNDMAKALKEMARTLKPGKYAVMILGDSAPYGVYIPTHEYLGKIATNVGFSEYRTLLLRKRGDKWKYVKETGRRHGVSLGEYMLILRK